MDKPQYERPHLYEAQRVFVDCTARYTVVEASTKCGKTVSCLIWLFEQALRGKPGQHFWWVAPIFAQSGIAFERLKKWLSDPVSKVSHGMWRANETDQTITIAGRIIEFKGADKPDSLYGEDCYAVVVDEASRCKEESWHAVRSTLTATGGPAKIIGNVRGRKNWAYSMARRAEAGAPNMAYFRITALDAVAAGILNAEEIEDARRTLPDAVYRELYLAQPSDDGGNPFGLSAIAKCAIDELAPGPTVAFGVDLAKSVDFTVACGLNINGHVSALDRWQGDWAHTRRRVTSIVGNLPAVIDSTGVGDPIVEDLSKDQHTMKGFKFTSASKQQLMEGLAAAIQKEEIKFPRGWLVNELEAFEYEYTRTGVRYTAAAGMHDDGVCALALAWHCFRERASRPQLETRINVSAFGPSRTRSSFPF